MLDNILKIGVLVFCLIYVIQSVITFYNLVFKNFAKDYYKSRLNSIKGRILDAEYSIEQARGVREGRRTEYDRLKEMQDACQVRIDEENKKEDPDKTIIEQMTALKDKYNPDIEKLAQQMEILDKQIDGPLQNDQQSMMETLDGLHAVVNELKAKIKKV